MSLPAQYARVAINCSGPAGIEWQNILWFEIVGAFSSTFDINAAAASIDTEYEGAYRAVMGLDTFYNGTDLRVNNGGVTGVGQTILAAAGTGGDPCAPPEVAAVVRLSTAHPGKTGRGRVFISGLDNAAVFGGKIDTIAIMAFNTLANKFKTGLAIQGQSWTPCLYSRTDVAFYPIAAVLVDTVLGTQRRRRPRR